MIELLRPTKRCFAILLVLIVVGVGHAVAQQAEVTLFEDGFDGGLGAWESASSTWNVNEGLIVSDPRYVSELIGGHPEWQNISLEYEFELSEPIQGTGRMQLLFRWQDAWHGYGLIVNEREIQFVRFEGGPHQLQVLARTSQELPLKEVIRLKVQLQGRRMTAYLDGRPILQAMDPVNTHPTGKIGFRAERVGLGLQRVHITGSDAEHVLDANWIAGQSDLDRLLAGFPPLADDLQGGFMPPGISEAAGAENIMLIYTHAKEWNFVDALPYVAYGEMVRERGALPRFEWHDWFFDTFLFLALTTPGDDRAFDSADRGAPATWDDWVAFISDLFRPDAQFAAFDQAVAHVKDTLDDPAYRAKVIVMIPYPAKELVRFGDPLGQGRTLDFSLNRQSPEQATQARLTAVTAFMDGFLDTWEDASYENLELVGFYWLAELIYDIPGERELISRTADAIHDRDLRFFWIPYYSAAGFADWKQVGFDAVMLQPNYMFNTRLSRNRLTDAAAAAFENGMGVEIEADGNVMRSAEGRQRYLDYLWAGVKYGYMEDALKAYYQEHDILGRAFMSSEPDVRDVYDQTYLFAKGLLGKEPTNP